MGAVHGVYLKYVDLSALSYAGYATLTGDSPLEEALQLTRSLRESSSLAERETLLSAGMSIFRLSSTCVLGYSAVLNGAVAVMFKLRRGMSLIGKCPQTGKIPMWSYVIYFPFHVPTYIYTHFHTKSGKNRKEGRKVPVASEVQPGWWVGGCYANELNRDWSGVVDLTVEFPERCIDRCKNYLLLPTWDGVPANPAQLEEAAIFAVKAREGGDVVVHCAHGRGRSTTVMCACLVKAGMFATWQEAFEKGIKPGRPVCKLNSKMKKALTEWQRDYVDGKKEV